MHTTCNFQFDECPFTKSVTHFISVDPVLFIDETLVYYIILELYLNLIFSYIYLGKTGSFQAFSKKYIFHCEWVFYYLFHYEVPNTIMLWGII